MYIHTARLTILLVIVHVSTQECNKEKNAETPEIRLRAKLLCNYDKDLIPVTNTSEVLNITLGMSLMQYSISDQKVSEIHSTNEIIVSWMDTFLTWNPDDYESINDIVMNTDEFWSPNITPMAIDFLSDEPSILQSVECQVSSIGNVTCIVANSYHGYCINDLSQWPHDVFTCKLRYNLFAQHGELIYIHPEPETVNIMPDANYDCKVLNQSMLMWSGRPQQYITMHELMYVFELQHITATYHFGFVIPALVLSIMSLMSYWVSTQKSDRVVLISLNLVAHLYQIQHTKWNIADSGATVPFVVRFYRDSLIMVAIGLFETMVLRKIVTSDMVTPRWMVLLDKITNRHVIRRLLLLDLLELQETEYEEQASIGKQMKLFNRNNQMEKHQIAQILDRILFVILFLVYFVLLLILMTY